MKLKLHPAVAMLESPYPLYRIWAVHQDDYRGEIAVDLDSGPDQVIVYRPDFRAAVAKLSRGELTFLAGIKHGAPLVTALESALATDAEFDLGASLQRWAAMNVAVDLSVETTEMHDARRQ